MRKIRIILTISFSLTLLGCGEAPSKSSNSNSRFEAKVPKEEAANTGINNTANADFPKNNSENSDITKSANVGFANSSSSATDLNKAANAADSKSANSSSANTNTAKSANSSSNSNPSSSPSPTTEKTEKKDEGLFSFPPPKVTDVTEINRAKLAAGGETANLSQISEKLSEGLKNAGYTKDKYSYFWNDNEEFAIVTSMERVNADGSAFEEDRWVMSDSLPVSQGIKQYFTYLFEGKKVYYRVFAFIVTARRKQNSFRANAPPEFITALQWKNKGNAELGDGEPASVENAVFTEKHKCFALVYLFVNHTSLDAPKSVDSLSKDERDLPKDLSKEADTHLRKTKFLFGGE